MVSKVQSGFVQLDIQPLCSEQEKVLARLI